MIQNWLWNFLANFIILPKLPGVLESFPRYSIILYIDITTSRSFALSSCVLFISFIQLVNGAQSLNIAFLLFLPACLARAVAPDLITVMVALTSMLASL